MRSLPCACPGQKGSHTFPCYITAPAQPPSPVRWPSLPRVGPWLAPGGSICLNLGNLTPSPPPFLQSPCQMPPPLGPPPKKKGSNSSSFFLSMDILRRWQTRRVEGKTLALSRPGFTSHPYHFPAVWLWVNGWFSKLQFAHLLNGDCHPCPKVSVEINPVDVPEVLQPIIQVLKMAVLIRMLSLTEPRRNVCLIGEGAPWLHGWP